MSTPKSDFPVGKPLFLGLLTAVVLVVGFGGWASLTNISGAIVASGQIEVDQNRQVVQHPDGGVVSEILVDEGMLWQQVKLSCVWTPRSNSLSYLLLRANYLSSWRAEAASKRSGMNQKPSLLILGSYKHQAKIPKLRN